MLIRTQVQLTEEQAQRLKRMAAQRGVSLAALVREAVDEKLRSEADERRAVWERAMSVIGKFHDIEGKTDVAERHDEYYAEAIEDHLKERRRESS